MEIRTEKIIVPEGDGFPELEKEVTFLFGQGENCTCPDCPVLYGGECYTTEENNRKALIEDENE